MSAFTLWTRFRLWPGATCFYHVGRAYISTEGGSNVILDARGNRAAHFLSGLIVIPGLDVVYRINRREH